MGGADAGTGARHDEEVELQGFRKQSNGEKLFEVFLAMFLTNGFELADSMDGNLSRVGSTTDGRGVKAVESNDSACASSSIFLCSFE